MVGIYRKQKKIILIDPTNLDNTLLNIFVKYEKGEMESFSTRYGRETIKPPLKVYIVGYEDRYNRQNIITRYMISEYKVNDSFTEIKLSSYIDKVGYIFDIDIDKIPTIPIIE
jgi:hypothetical protein